VAYDDALYARPHAALVAAVALGDENSGGGSAGAAETGGRVALAVPSPPGAPPAWEGAARWVEANARQLRTVFGVMICAALAKMLRRGAAFATSRGAEAAGATNSADVAGATNSAAGAGLDEATAGRGRKSTSGGSAKKRRGGDKTPKA
jgi:hypothetical protein